MLTIRMTTKTISDFRDELAVISDRMRVVPDREPAVFVRRYNESIGVMLPHTVWERILDACDGIEIEIVDGSEA